MLLISFYIITNITMEKFYVITHNDGKEARNFYFKDMAIAIIQFREFMEQAGITERIEWDMPVTFEYGDWCKLTLWEREFDDNKLYHL